MNKIIAQFLLFLYAIANVYGQVAYNRILLTSIQTLTFTRGQYTTGRRLPPVQQLQCMDGCAFYNVYNAQCYNRGTNGQTVQWECNAQLPNQVSFGTLKVSCEGYDSSTDPYVLGGSCALQYTLVSAYGASSPVTGGIIGGVVGGIFLCFAAIVSCITCRFCCKNRFNTGLSTIGSRGRSYTTSHVPTPAYYTTHHHHTTHHHDSGYMGGSSGGTHVDTGFASTDNR